MSRFQRTLMLLTDIGFVLYWVVTALHLIPPSLAFKDYTNPILAAWNWSFLPLDLLISATGIAAILLFKRSSPLWFPLSLVSLTLTVCSGLMAVVFWAIRHDYDIAWWIPNLFLLIYPLPFLWRLSRGYSR